MFSGARRSQKAVYERKERGRNVKDLKHLIYFEDLLQEANNELVAQAQKEGMKCIGYMCENVPEPLINLPGCFSARLRAPRTGSSA